MQTPLNTFKQAMAAGELKLGLWLALLLNKNLPFMYHDAMVPDNTFDMVLDNSDYDYTLFSTPNMAVEMADYMIGMSVPPKMALS